MAEEVSADPGREMLVKGLRPAFDRFVGAMLPLTVQAIKSGEPHGQAVAQSLAKKLVKGNDADIMSAAAVDASVRMVTIIGGLLSGDHMATFGFLSIYNLAVEGGMNTFELAKNTYRDVQARMAKIRTEQASAKKKHRSRG